MTADEKGFLVALEENPDDATARAAYADWLEEHGRRYEAILQRGRAGASEVYFKLRRKSDGLFFECDPHKRERWTTKGKAWHDLARLRAHMGSYARSRTWGAGPIRYMDNTPWDDLEVVVVELRVVEGAALPVRYAEEGSGYRRRVTITTDEPLGRRAGG
ncbi:MAG: TIGR02996 domain-containing protein [Planctomycetes bacterium]|nr:TIGR02996 domain-containing protein [Planctomycetota bacterium]